MKKIVMGALVGLLFFTMAATASASLPQFLGTWTNTNPNTRGLTKLIITDIPGSGVMVHAWGQCHPQDCDWGNMLGFAYAPNVSAKLDAQTEAITVVHKESFAERLLIIHRAEGNRLRVATYTRFTDKSGRSNYVDVEHFSRAPDPLAQCMAANQRAHAEVHQMYQNAKKAGKIDPKEAQAFAAMEKRLHDLGQQLARGGWTLAECQQFSRAIAAERAALQRMAATPALKEDCIPFNFNQVEVRNVDGRWTVVQGNMLMINFASHKDQAERAVQIIKHYKLDRQCFVGRPGPSMQYYTTQGHAPQGSLPGEDCLSFNLNNVQVQNIGGRWKIVDGSHWILDFEKNEAEARTAFTIMKHYGFNQICFVGRPNPPMTYFKK
jgi:hypothetical protein